MLSTGKVVFNTATGGLSARPTDAMRRDARGIRFVWTPTLRLSLKCCVHTKLCVWVQTIKAWARRVLCDAIRREGHKLSVVSGLSSHALVSRRTLRAQSVKATVTSKQQLKYWDLRSHPCFCQILLTRSFLTLNTDKLRPLCGNQMTSYGRYDDHTSRVDLTLKLRYS